MITVLLSNVHVTASVKGCSEYFYENIGTRQGCPLGPQLFNFFIRDLPDFLFSGNDNIHKNDALYLHNQIIRCLLYADDLVLLSRSAEGLQHQLDLLCENCKLWFLNDNVSKTA